MKVKVKNESESSQRKMKVKVPTCRIVGGLESQETLGHVDPVLDLRPPQDALDEVINEAGVLRVSLRGNNNNNSLFLI